jgi:HEAT repeats
MTTPFRDYPVGSPAPRPRRAARPRLVSQLARVPINWIVVGVAGGLAVIAVVVLALLCATPRRVARPIEVAANPEPVECFVEPAPITPLLPPPEAVAEEPAAPEPGALKPAGSAPPTDVRPGSGPAAFAKRYGEPDPVRFRHRDLLSADELSHQLLTMPEVDLDAQAGTSARLLEAARLGNSKFTHPVLEPLLKRNDLHGLPVAMGVDCQLGKESAENLQVLSRKLRLNMSQSVAAGNLDPRIDAAVLRERVVEGNTKVVAGTSPQKRVANLYARGKAGTESRPDDWRQEDALPALVQMLQAEDRPVRLLLVELLAEIKGRTASAALARRALFDLAADVREAAVRALRERPRDEYRGLLLDGLRYPWAPAADHAAEALVALDDRESLPLLTALLDESDPAGAVARAYRPIDPAVVWTAPRPKEPFGMTVVALDERPGGERRTNLLTNPDDLSLEVKASARQVYAVREVVRVNHLRNCLLCHAAATSPNDPVRGLVPTPGQPLPPITTPYYEGPNGVFVRADVTYLRQDFSVPQPVAKAGNWPAHQRYDYVVRTRYPTEEELRRKEPTTYPQREAVRWALRELNGGKEG